MKHRLRLLLFVATLGVCLFFIAQNHPALAQDAADAAQAAAPAAGDEPIPVQIDWIAELWKGGFTVLAQLALSVLGLGVAIERFIAIRRGNFAPPKFLERVLPLGASGDWDAAIEEARNEKSLLGRIVEFIAEHRHNEIDHIQQGAGDIGVREMRHQLQRIYPLAVVGSLAPLLGLLGTMIGMIESFALVAMYGDEGGASLLADSIAKALITTAVGLIIAIPALGVYYWLKQRAMGHMAELETSVEAVMDEWFLRPVGRARAKALEERRNGGKARPAKDARDGKDAEARRADRPERPARPPKPAASGSNAGGDAIDALSALAPPAKP